MKKRVCLALVLVLATLMVPLGSLAQEESITARFIYHSLIEKMASEGIDYNDNRIWNFHKENSGIDVIIEPALVDGTQENQKKAMILASGDVPDLMVFGQADYFMYALDGVFLSTDGYLAGMPNYMALVPETAREICRVNGVLYALPGSHEETEMWGGSGIVVRKDVFDTLGIEEPQTTGEYYEMFKLVKEQTDMIPVVGKGFDTFKAAFGVLSRTKKTDEKLVFTWAQPEFKEYLAYMYKLYNEGLLDQEYVNTTTAILQEKFINNIAFSSSQGWASPCVTINGVVDRVEGAQLAYLKQMTKDAETPAELTLIFPTQRINVIPAMAKNPDLAAQFIEYMSTPEAKMVQNYGIEGVDYTVDGEGNIQQTLEEQNNVGWKICYEYIPTPDSFQVRLFAKGFDVHFYGLLDKREESNVIGVRDALTFLPPNEDYLNLQQQLGLKTYSDEQADKFIMGERSLDEFDAYLSELEARGLSRLEEALNDWAASVK